MKFELAKSLEILSTTPTTLRALITPLSDEWTHNTEGKDTWSVYDVIGHLIHGEKTDWMLRTKLILNAEHEPFPPFDRFAQFNESQDKKIRELLDDFERYRSQNIEELQKFDLNEEKLALTGVHPNFGTVTLRQLLATWSVHDLTHIAQIARVIGKQYADEVGPWKAYIGILNR